MPSFSTCAGKPKPLRVRRVDIFVIPPSERFSDNAPQTQGLWESLTAKIINNLQVTVKNIHVRYEDKLSVPGVRDRIV